MEKPKTFWQECYDTYYAQCMPRPTTELVDDFNKLIESPVLSSSVTARLTALIALFRFRGYNLQAMQSGSSTMRLTKIKVEDGKILPLNG
jgi:hypothetical protein